MDGNDNIQRAPLRVGLLVDSLVQPRWIYEVVRSIQSSPIARVVLVVKNEAKSPEKKYRVQSYWENRRHLLYAAYTRFDARASRVEHDAFAPADLGPLVEGCAVVGVEPVMKKFSDWFGEEDLREIVGHELDVALRFGFRILRGDALKIARHGVWSYHHGDAAVNRGGPAGFWEVMGGEPVTGTMLQVLTEELDDGRILYRSWSPTSDKFSVRASRNEFYWKATAFVMRKLRELYESGELRLEKNSLYLPYSKPLYKTPTNSELAPMLARMAGRYAVSKTRSLAYFDQWALAYRFRSSPTDANNSFYKFKYLIPPKDRFWADPFPVRQGDKYFIFAEEYPYTAGKGHVSVFELDRSGPAQDPVKVLENEYHLSYPFIFEWGGGHFMIPETYAKRRVEMYRCASFPDRWEPDGILLDDVSATDATLMEVEGRWWMFANVAEGQFPYDWNELHLFHAERPSGPWRPHRRNPVKTDVRGSRPAGRLFYWHGDLYRPAQDSSKRYGHAISLNRVLRLDADDFIEEEVSKIRPEWRGDIVGTHTLNTAHDLTVIDCLMRRRKFF